MLDLWRSFSQQISISSGFSSASSSAPPGRLLDMGTHPIRRKFEQIWLWGALLTSASPPTLHLIQQSFTSRSLLTPSKCFEFVKVTDSCRVVLLSPSDCPFQRECDSGGTEEHNTHSVSYSGTETRYVLQSFGDNLKAFWERQGNCT